MRRFLSWAVAALFLLPDLGLPARADDAAPAPGEDVGAAAPAEAKPAKKSSRKARKKPRKGKMRAKKVARKAKNKRKAARAKKGHGLPAADPGPGQAAGGATEFMPPPPAPEATPAE